jgi:uncharacterized protein YbaR (Trm112 family)
MGEFNTDLLHIIVCPVCGGSLKLGRDDAELECERCEIKYPIIGGIPELMPPKLK